MTDAQSMSTPITYGTFHCLLLPFTYIPQANCNLGYTSFLWGNVFLVCGNRWPDAKLATSHLRAHAIKAMSCILVFERAHCENFRFSENKICSSLHVFLMTSGKSQKSPTCLTFFWSFCTMMPADAMYCMKCFVSCDNRGVGAKRATSHLQSHVAILFHCHMICYKYLPNCIAYSVVPFLRSCYL